MGEILTNMESQEKDNRSFEITENTITITMVESFELRLVAKNFAGRDGWVKFTDKNFPDGGGSPSRHICQCCGVKWKEIECEYIHLAQLNNSPNWCICDNCCKLILEKSPNLSVVDRKPK